MKRIVKLFFSICFIIIPVFIEFYYLFEGIQEEIKYKQEYNGYTALLTIIPSGSLAISSCAYVFVKMKHFPIINMLLGFIILSIGELFVCFRYQFSFGTVRVWKIIPMIVVVSLWIFLKSCIFKKIYKWLE